MPVHASPTDPRSIITPDAFEVSEALLGMPLARPGKRLWAVLIDLVVIGVITGVTKSFALILGVAAAVLFIRAGFKRTPVRGSVFGRAMRFSVGCLGIVVAITTAILWSAFGWDLGSGPDVDARVQAALEEQGVSGGGELGLGDVASLAMGAVALNRTEDLDEARRIMRRFLTAGRAAGASRADLREELTAMVPDESAWADEAPEMIDELIAEVWAEEPPGAEAGETEATLAEVDAAAEVAALTTTEALREYAGMLEEMEAAPTTSTADPLFQALRARLVLEVAADTLAALEEDIEALQDENAATTRQLARTRDALEEATGGGLLAWLRDFVDELGFGFGWAGLYMTVVLSWWKGQTVGKKLMGIRVVRLDGEPINWWTAFERAGGYAAGFATGLLGFAQVWWDANRQAIHDRIVGTVVVVDGAEPVGNWEAAL